jgi:hypothetical protein
MLRKLALLALLLLAGCGISNPSTLHQRNTHELHAKSPLSELYLIGYAYQDSVNVFVYQKKRGQLRWEFLGTYTDYVTPVTNLP